MDALLDGFGSVLSFDVLLAAAVGAMLGLVLSSLPGVPGVLAVVALLPVSLGFDLTVGLALLLGAYTAIQYGGVLPATAVGMSGSPESAATVADAYGMTRAGYPRRALGLSLHAGTAAGLLSNVFVAIMLPVLASVTLAFGTRELFAVCVVGLVLLPTAVAGASWTKGMVGVLIGVFLSTIGTDPIVGQVRLTFGIEELRGGIGIVPLVTGALAMGVVLDRMLPARRTGGSVDSPGEASASMPAPRPDDRVSWRPLFKRPRELALGTVVGTLMGIIPGSGATMASYTAWGVAGRLKSNRGTNFGTGSAGGIVAAESANNATVGPAFVPLMAFGIPGTALAAIIAGAFVAQGITPGPALFRTQPELIYVFIALLILALVVNQFLGRIYLEIYRFVPQVPDRLLLPFIGTILIIGTYVNEASFADVVVMVAIGLLAFAMNRGGYPTAPMVIAFLIAPLLEVQLRRALLIGDSWTYLFTSPVALVVYGILVAIALVSLGLRMLRRRARLVAEEAGLDQAADVCAGQP